MHNSLITMLRYIDTRLLYLFASVFIIPVCLIIQPSRKTAYHYFRNRLGYGRIKAAWKTYINHCLFAQVVIDRFAMYAGKKFAVEIEDFEYFQRLVSQPEGFMILSAHIGNYEIAGYSLQSDKKIFNALVFAGEKEIVMLNRNKLFTDNNVRMIPVRQDMSHLFEINTALSNGEVVSMPADRIHGSQKSLTKNFLAATAPFPHGPFSVATMRGLDVLAVNVMKSSLTKYRIHITPLNYDKTQSRAKQMDELSSAYVAELERMIKMYPAQWYNFYEFWK
ncbi:MAG: lysophospholipid acyltransferase family protein [Prevotella sp.]|nr:lysophospholipid acyltransferase family protein [Candidatus Prevotella equi]